MSIAKNDIIEELFRLAKKNETADTDTSSERPEPNPFAEDTKVIEEKRLKPSEKSIIEEAHPEPVYVAESLGDGALVENQVEQQKKIVDIVNRMPTGNLVARYAQVALELVKIANRCDDLGNATAADLITDAATSLLKLAEDNDLGFVCPDCEKPEAQCECKKEYCDACDRTKDKCICGEKDLPFGKAPIV